MTTEEQSANGATVRVVVDGERCIGAGQCELLEPDVFRVDDNTAVALLLGDGQLAADRASEVLDRCPSGAITIVPS